MAAGPDHDGGFVIFPLRRLRNDGSDDLSCVLHPADHEDVGRYPMVVSYEEGRPLPVAALDHMRGKGLLVACAPLKPHVLVRVQRGAIKSEFTPTKLALAVAASMPTDDPTNSN